MSIKEFVKQYIEPFKWDGTLLCDGGWGPKNEIMEFTVKLQKKGILVVTEPLSNLVEVESNKVIDDIDFGNLNDLLNLMDSSIKGTNEHYRFSFPGEHSQALFLFLVNFKNVMKFELNSFLKEAELEEKQDIYQLIVEKNEDQVISLTINKGNWIPSFHDAIPIEGITYNGRN